MHRDQGQNVALRPFVRFDELPSLCQSWKFTLSPTVIHELAGEKDERSLFIIMPMRL